MIRSFSEETLSMLRDVLRRRIGIRFFADQRADLERGICNVATDLGFDDPNECVRWLADGYLSRGQIETLASHFTVGETYFFREPKAFALLESRILPELVRMRQADETRRIRIWSAGCSTGEEAYSIAITLLRCLPDVKNWGITVLATDINPAALRKASAGIFGEWSFRSTPGWVKSRYFKRLPNGRYAIDPAVKPLVRFAYLNLAEDEYPSLLSDTNSMDVIFCRNVLLYFSSELGREVVSRFHHALLPGGWLVGGLAECFQAAGFERDAFEVTGFFRKPARAPAPEEAEPIEAEAVPAPSPAPPPPSALEPPSEPPPSPQTLVERARQAADQGRLEEALRHCEAALAADGSNASYHYLRATILSEAGNLLGAEKSLRRSLVISPGFILAHYSLAALTRRQGRHAESAQHLSNAAILLTACDPDEIVPESDGITAGRFAEIVRASGRISPPVH